MKMNVALLFLTVGTIIDTSDAAKILGVIPTPSYSHQIVFRPIWKSLSQRGHQLTVITTDPINDSSLTNLTEIDINFSYKYFRSELVQRAFMNEDSPGALTYFKIFLSCLDMIVEMTEEQLHYPPVQNLIKDENQHFDLVMVEVLNPMMLAFGKRFNCPTIGLLSFDANVILHQAVGNPTNPALYPDVALALEGRLTFLERLQSSLYVVVMGLIQKYLDSLAGAKFVENFGEKYPTLSEMMSNIDMLFLNTHPVLDMIRPSVPSVIYMGGGSHLEASKELPKEIKDYLDGASNGFIYFSLGTNIRSIGIKEELRQVILETFSELPYRILWKFEADELPGKPANVKTMKWLPQQDILRHPNVKLFITQGGLQSMEEAIFSHVPLVVMPFMGDQETNAKKIVNRGYGLSVDRRTVTKELFKQTILEVINNEKYRHKIKEVAELVLDQPMSGIQSAVWWTEYVLRHKGAKHLRNPGLDMPWYQYLLLDVIAFILVVIVVVSLVVCKILKVLFRCVKASITKKKVKMY